MYKYKRGMNNIDLAKNMEYILSSNSSASLCMSACLGNTKPYNGLYIKNGKIMVENLVEKIEVKDKVYKIVELATTAQNLSSSEYVKSIDLDSNTFEYDLGSITYTKKIGFKKDTRILCIEYNIKNSDSSKAKFKILPLVTYRELFHMRNSQMLKFNQRKDSSGVIINLSIMENENIYLKSPDMKWTKEILNLTNVRHEYVDIDGGEKTFTEDLLIPGGFETIIKPKTEKKIQLYISCDEFNVDELDSEDIFNENLREYDKLVSGINENYVELRQLALLVNNANIKEGFISKLPYSKLYDSNAILKLNQNIFIKDLEELIDIVKSVDGQYLAFDKIQDASKELLLIRRYIKEIELISNDKELAFIKKFVLLKLWYIESVNRFLQKENDYLLYTDFIKEAIYFVLNQEYKKELYKDVEIVALMYNAIRIYESIIRNTNDLEDVNMNDELINIVDLIKNKFWCEDKRVLKRNLDDEETYASVYMIYALSLSYPCLLEDIPIKLLDTVFKELYTPYGLREFSKNCSLSNGIIYPKYMAHFVKANLRQNGVTRASQKIAYNLVKELMLEIGKHVNGGIKKIYHEKGKQIDSIAFDLLTNSEMIRLYDMLT